jgi:hypothetical protein
LLAAVAAVGVDEQLRLVTADGAGLTHPVQVTARVGAPRLADLDLHSWDALLEGPMTELFRQLSLGVADESADAIDRHVGADGAVQPEQRLLEQPAFRSRNATSTA